MVDKIKLVPVTGANNIANINDNFSKIEKLINNKMLSRKTEIGEPNQVQVDIDMNNNRIYNLPAPRSPTEPLTAGFIGDLTETVAQGQANIAASNELVRQANIANDEARSILADTHIKLDGALDAITDQKVQAINQINSTASIAVADINTKQADITAKHTEIVSKADTVNTQTAQVAVNATIASAAATGAANSAATATTQAGRASAAAASVASDAAQASQANISAQTAATTATSAASSARADANRAEAAANGIDTGWLRQRDNHLGTQPMSTIAGLKSAAGYDIGTSGATVPLLGGVNTWGGTQTFTGLNGGQLAGFRNRVINGNHIINQRVGGWGVPATGQFVYLTDHWVINSSGSGNFDVVTSTDTPLPEFSGSLQITHTSASGGASNAGSTLQQCLDGAWAAPLVGKACVLSFWIKSSVAGTSSANLSVRSKTDVTSTIQLPYTIANANVWEKKVVKIPTIPADTVTSANSLSIKVVFPLDVGSANRSPNQNTWQTGSLYGYAPANAYIGTSPTGVLKITGIQLEAGTEATPFEHRSLQVEMAHCMRYYKIVRCASFTGVTFTGNGDTRGMIYSDSISMRADPTITPLSNTVSINSAGSNTSTLNTLHTVGFKSTYYGQGLGLASLTNFAAIAGVGDVVSWGTLSEVAVALSAEML